MLHLLLKKKTMKEQYKNKLLKLKNNNNLTYNNCYIIINNILSKEFNIKNKIKGNFLDIYEFYYQIEKILEIHIWDDVAEEIKTIDDLTLIIFHELISKNIKCLLINKVKN